METMKNLINHLSKMSACELDEILDKRDSDIFDSAWCSANAEIPDSEIRLDTKEIFIELSEATECHEVCSYISDDLELINKAQIASYKSEFIQYLEKCYEQGVVPCEWQS